MKLRTEAIVFLLVAAYVGLHYGGPHLGSANRGGSRRSSSARNAREYVPVTLPELDSLLPREDRDGNLGRDLFAPPSDTAPLPPLTLEMPPVEPLLALRPPTAYGPQTGQAELLSAMPTVHASAGLFDAPLAQSGASGDEVLPIAPEDLTPEQRAARREAYKRQYDWVVLVGGRTLFGQIRNKDRYGLSRENSDILFVEIDPETGSERFPGQQAIPLARANVTEFGLAATPLNFVEEGLRSFDPPLRHSDLEHAREFAARCLELRNETPRALEVAEEVYRMLSEAAPSDVRGPLGLARCYELGFRFEDAYQAYREMIAGDLKVEPQPWARLGDLLARFRLFGEAEKMYLEALRVQSSHWEARWRYGRFLLERGRFEEALGHLEEAVRREPSAPELRWARVGMRADLATALLQLGRAREAYQRFEQARNANPAVDLGLAGMISSALFLDDVSVPAAEPDGEEGPDASFDLLLALGLDALDGERWLEARRYLESAAAADPFRSWMAKRALSWLAEITGNPEQAYAFIEEAYQIEPTDPWTLYQLGRLLEQRGDDLSAREAFQAALDRELDFADALIALGKLHQQAGEHEAAERYYERALSIDPNRPVVHSLRGFNHFSLGQPAAAREDFEAALALREDLASAQNGLAWWLYASGDSPEALVRFDRVVETRRDAPEDDPHRLYAIRQRERIIDHEKKEVWTDRFDRVGSIAGGWSLDESDGVVANLRDGEVWLEGRFEHPGKGRIYQTLPAERFLSLEVSLTIHDAREARVLVFVSKEQVGRGGEIRTQSKIALRRNHDGRVQATFVRRGQHEEEVLELGDTTWPLGQPVRVRIETNGDPTDTRMSVWLDDLPVLENHPVQSLGRSQMPVRFGVAVEGESGRSATVSVDEVRVVRRK